MKSEMLFLACWQTPFLPMLFQLLPNRTGGPNAGKKRLLLVLVFLFFSEKKKKLLCCDGDVAENGDLV